MPKALLIIDYTNDFIADQGALTCGQPAQALAPYITHLAEEFYQAGDYVIFPTDAHNPNDHFHPESKLFPPHNLVGTWGQALYGPVKDWYDAHQADERVYQFNKNRYSAFQNTNLDNYLRERHINELWLVGVCTDICVLHTAMAAYNLNYQLTIPAAGVTTFTEHGQEWALDHFAHSLGAKVLA